MTSCRDHPITNGLRDSGDGCRVTPISNLAQVVSRASPRVSALPPARSEFRFHLDPAGVGLPRKSVAGCRDRPVTKGLPESDMVAAMSASITQAGPPSDPGSERSDRNALPSSDVRHPKSVRVISPSPQWFDGLPENDRQRPSLCRTVPPIPRQLAHRGTEPSSDRRNRRS